MTTTFRSAAIVSSLIGCALLTGCCSSSMGMFPSPVSKELHVVSIDLDLTDHRRSRDVPIRIHLPEGREEPLPVIFVSHGIGESRTAYEWLGRNVAAAGYVVIHPTHRGTDREKLEEGWIAMYRATQDRENWKNRPLDISFILDHLPTIEAMDQRLAGAFDVERVGVIGHSAGAWTAAAIAGLDLESGESFLDSRVDAIAPLSMPRTGSVSSPDAWNSLTLPALHMTGTCDRQFIWRTLPWHRRIPWENATADDQYLLTLEGGTHVTFSNPWDPAKTRQTALQMLTARAVTAFLDGYVAGDEKRRNELRSGGFVELGGRLLRVEQRPPLAR